MTSTLRMGLNRWLTWSGRSVNRRIFAAMITVGGFTFLVKLAAAAKEVVVAHQFGTRDALDAFLIAFLLPSFAINVVAGSFNAALIPTFIEVREQDGQEAAQQLFSSIMVWSTALLIAVSAILGLTASYVLPILGSGFLLEKLVLTRSLFYLLLPVLLISGLITIWAAILQARERFALAAAAPVMMPVITVVTILALGKVLGIYALAIGVVGGFTLEAALLAWGLKHQGFSLIPRWHGMSPPTSQVMKQYAPMVAGAFLMSSTNLVDQSMAAMLGPGSVSILSYGNKVVAFTLSIASVAMSTAIFPHFSRMVANRDWSSITHTLRTYLCLIVLVSIPVSALLAYFSEPLVRVIFERGAFTQMDTHNVAQVQAMYVLQIAFYLSGILFVRLISAMKGNWVLMCSAILSFPLNIILNIVLMRYMGVSGIALSTSLVYAVSLAFLSVMSYRTMRKLMN